MAPSPRGPRCYPDGIRVTILKGHAIPWALAALAAGGCSLLLAPDLVDRREDGAPGDGAVDARPDADRDGGVPPEDASDDAATDTVPDDVEAPCVPEVCNGLDDDCDGEVDNGFACAMGSERACETCGMPGVQVCDETCTLLACDARCPPEAPSCCAGSCVNTGSNAAHCGDCDQPCGSGQGCCGGECVGLTTVEHCGVCFNTCGGGQPACCSSECKDLSNDWWNCGRCGNRCRVGQLCLMGSCKWF